MAEQTHQGRDYTLAEAAALLRYSKATVYKKVRGGEWPYTRLGHKITFTAENVAAIRELGKVEPIPARTTRNRKAS